jgi:hypothetical protein
MGAAVVIKVFFTIVHHLLKQGDLFQALCMGLKLWQESGHVKVFGSKKLKSGLPIGTAAFQ